MQRPRTSLYLLICRLNPAIAAGSGEGACTAVGLGLAGLSSSDEISIISWSMSGDNTRGCGVGLAFFLLDIFFDGGNSSSERATIMSAEFRAVETFRVRVRDAVEDGNGSGRGW